MSHYRIIADLDELRWFYDHGIPRLLPHECYYMSMSARAKKLSAEERKHYNFQHNEMFGKELLTHDSFENLVRHLRRYECAEGSYTDKNGNPYPQKCLVCYWNINPSSAVKTVQKVKEYISDFEYQLASSQLQKSEQGMEQALVNMKLLPHRIYTLASQARSRRVWLDVDMDFEDAPTEATVQGVRETLGAFLPKGATILTRTGGGLHALLKVEHLGENASPQSIVKALSARFSDGSLKECIVNPNPMTVLPGTLQYGEPVVVLNKKDFVGETATP
jgi:hypothetical protein